MILLQHKYKNENTTFYFKVIITSRKVDEQLEKMVKKYGIELKRVYILNSFLSKFNNAGKMHNNNNTTRTQNM